MDAPSDKPTEDLLFEAMDRQALRFINMLDDEEQDSDGNPRVSIEMKLKVFDKGQEWLTKRQKLRPARAEEMEGAGIRDMRLWMNDPAKREEMREMFEAVGVVVMPDAKVGRPTLKEKARREKYKAAKTQIENGGEPPPDAGWREMLGEQE